MRRPSRNRISSPYGVRIHPITGIRTMHNGTDFSSAPDLTIYAPMNCRVTSYRNSGDGYGNKMVLNNDAGVVMWLCHTARAIAGIGPVREGDPIAIIGNTGNSTGPHLHQEVFVNGVRVDPIPWTDSQTAGGGGATPIDPTPSHGQETDDMIHYLCVATSSNGMIGKDQRFVQGAEGPLRCLSDGEWGPIALSSPPVAQWTGDMIVNLVARIGIREYVFDARIPGGVGKLTGRILYGPNLGSYPAVTAVNAAAPPAIDVKSLAAALAPLLVDSDLDEGEVAAKLIEPIKQLLAGIPNAVVDEQSERLGNG